MKKAFNFLLKTIEKYSIISILISVLITILNSLFVMNGIKNVAIFALALSMLSLLATITGKFGYYMVMKVNSRILKPEEKGVYIEIAYECAAVLLPISILLFIVQTVLYFFF